MLSEQGHIKAEVPATIVDPGRTSSPAPGLRTPTAQTPLTHAKVQWPRRYARRLLLSDALTITLTLGPTCAWLASVGTFAMPILGSGSIYYPWVLVAIGVAWLAGLTINETRSETSVGHGVAEYRGVASATIITFSLVVVVAFLARAELARSVLIFAAPIGLFLLLFSRWLNRQWLRRQQAAGRYLNRAVILGEWSKVSHITSVISSTVGTGYEFVGAITRKGESPQEGPLEVIGDYAHAIDVIDRVGADTVIVSSADDLTPQAMRLLSWAMAERDVQWVVAPAMTDVAGPRIHARPVAGLPLVHVSFPTLTGYRRVLKRTMDVVGAGTLIVLLSPVIGALALIVRLTSRGPVFYTQERIGLRGEPFHMIKFRSMIQNADAQLQALLAQQGTDGQPLFKVSDDPRITPVGRVLRKYSLDELPQLFNVFLGDMSLVGPRPQRPAEVALYDDIAHRRLLVKPGMSGLWQVSGRSALAWEDALRLDLYYVENWSIVQDLVILFRTVRAVVKPEDTAH